MNVPATVDTAKAAVDHAAMGHGTADTTAESAHSAMMAIHMRMLADTGIRRHMLADTTLRRLIVEMLPSMPDEHRRQVEQILSDTLRVDAPAGRRPAAARPPASRPPATPARPATPPPAKPDPHAGHKPPPKPDSQAGRAPPPA
jgi:hypothetical protein